jgi:hypothetical protein
LQPRIVNECGRLQSVTGCFGGKFLLGNAVEFGIDEIEQLLLSLALTAFGSFEEASHIAHAPNVVVSKFPAKHIDTWKTEDVAGFNVSYEAAKAVAGMLTGLVEVLGGRNGLWIMDGGWGSCEGPSFSAESNCDWRLCASSNAPLGGTTAPIIRRLDKRSRDLEF